MQVHVNQARHSLEFRPETNADGPLTTSLMKALDKNGWQAQILHTADRGTTIEVPIAHEWPEKEADRPDWQKTPAVKIKADRRI